MLKCVSVCVCLSRLPSVAREKWGVCRSRVSLRRACKFGTKGEKGGERRQSGTGQIN